MRLKLQPRKICFHSFMALKVSTWVGQREKEAHTTPQSWIFQLLLEIPSKTTQWCQITHNNNTIISNVIFPSAIEEPCWGKRMHYKNLYYWMGLSKENPNMTGMFLSWKHNWEIHLNLIQPVAVWSYLKSLLIRHKGLIIITIYPITCL